MTTHQNAWSTTLYSNVSAETVDILQEVSNERTRQVRKGWTVDHDALHPTAELADLARERIEVAGFTRESLIEAIAMLVAAVETLDRRG